MQPTLHNDKQNYSLTPPQKSMTRIFEKLKVVLYEVYSLQRVHHNATDIKE